jgi:hypothetical protein
MRQNIATLGSLSVQITATLTRDPHIYGRIFETPMWHSLYNNSFASKPTYTNLYIFILRIANNKAFSLSPYHPFLSLPLHLSLPPSPWALFLLFLHFIVLFFSLYRSNSVFSISPMASSVARMPGDDWPGLFAGSHAKHLKKIHLPKISIQPANQSQYFHSPKSKSKSNSHFSPREPDHDSEFVSTPSKRHHHSQKILDRWAAHQAREIVTTIERQAHEAELSALSSTIPPVSDRARCFIYRREPSPTPSDVSTCSAPAVSYGDVPQTVRASSLIQMWRDLEASTPRGIPCGKHENGVWGDESEMTTLKSPMVRPAVRGRGEIEELVARMEAERRREVHLIAEHHVVSQYPNRGRLQVKSEFDFGC